MQGALEDSCFKGLIIYSNTKLLHHLDWSTAGLSQKSILYRQRMLEIFSIDRIDNKIRTYDSLHFSRV